MMVFIMLTLSFTVAILLATVVSTIAMFAIMQSPKAMKWLSNYYIKQMNKIGEAFENMEFDEVKGL